MEQIKGIEPLFPVWKTGVITIILYLHYSVSLPSIIPIVMISSTPHITVKYNRLPMVELTNNFHHFDARQEIVKTKLTGRNDRTRTCGILVPNQALYQTEIHSEIFSQTVLECLSCKFQVTYSPFTYYTTYSFKC